MTMQNIGQEMVAYWRGPTGVQQNNRKKSRRILDSKVAEYVDT
jgi:hypothetical protein